MQLSDALIREFAYCEDRMHAASGDDHAYWLGKCVGIADALAIVHETEWVTAHHALWHAARNMRRNNAAA
jgi:hypothetical protein